MKKKMILLCVLVFPIILTGCSRGGGSCIDMLPWQEQWICLLVGNRELEPEVGQKCLQTLFKAYSWTAETVTEVPEGIEVQIWTETRKPLTLLVAETGAVYMEGTLYIPRGRRAGERFCSGFVALMDSGLPTYEPPSLVYICGGTETLAKLCQVNSWNYRTRAGEKFHIEDMTVNWQHVDWWNMDLSCPRSETEVCFSFSCRDPDKAELLAFCDTGTVPVELQGMSFTPYAGAHAYLLSVHWALADQGGYGNAMYVLLVEGACAFDLPETENSSTHLTLLEADAWGCSFTLYNDSPLTYSLGLSCDNGIQYGYALFQRTEFGGWKWLEPRHYQDYELHYFEPRKSCTFGLDWSWVQGTLEEGEYAILFSGGMYQDGPGLIDTVFSSLYFKLGGECFPDLPGQLELEFPPAGISSILETMSAHRYVQEIIGDGSVCWVVDQSFSLFRREVDGSLSYLMPEFAFPTDYNKPLFLKTGSVCLSVELAAAYRKLEAGDYILRRRLYSPSEEEQKHWKESFDRTWRTIPKEKITYLDTPFTLDTSLDMTTLEVEPLPSMYGPEYMQEDFPLVIVRGTFASEECTLYVCNQTEANVWLMYSTLYFYDEEWLPLARRLRQRNCLFPAGIAIPAEETREIELSFWPVYSTLAPGTYRLAVQADVVGSFTSHLVWVAIDFVIL